MTPGDTIFGVTGETDLAAILASMTPERIVGRFVFVSLPPGHRPHDLQPMASVVEDEGHSLVIPFEAAAQAGFSYDFVASWITLRVHSSLHAVGLTAAVSTALTTAGISCNVIAGFHHDHLLVPEERADEALEILRGLSGLGGGPTQQSQSEM